MTGCSSLSSSESLIRSTPPDSAVRALLGVVTDARLCEGTTEIRTLRSAYSAASKTVHRTETNREPGRVSSPTSQPTGCLILRGGSRTKVCKTVTSCFRVARTVAGTNTSYGSGLNFGVARDPGVADECGPANQTACPQGEVARVGKGADRASGQATDPYMIVGSEAQLRVFRISRFEEVIYIPICSRFMGDGTAVGAGNESTGHFGREGTKCLHRLAQASVTAPPIVSNWLTFRRTSPMS